MRRSKHRLLSAFGTGMFWAGAGTLGAFAVHMYIAPPTDTNSSEHTKLALVELIPGIARWAQPVHGPDTARSASTKAASAPEPLVQQLADTALRDAQNRVARQQADVHAQRVLVRSIQQELQRVGCYGGAVDGHWSDGTRSAMGAFNEKLHVKLPLNSPDYILLTMLQGHARQACGDDKPAGDKIVTAGVPTQRTKARPNVVVNQLSPAKPETGNDWPTTVQTFAAAPKQPPLRPAAGGEVRVTNSVLPKPEPFVQAASTPPAVPLPGRMTVGASLPPQALPDKMAAPVPAMMPPAAAAVKPPAPAARPTQSSQPSRAAPRPDPVRVSAPSPRQGSGGGGGGNSGGQVFSRLGSSAP